MENEMRKTGDIVTIYEKPFTGELREGEAVLVKKTSQIGDDERWDVRFINGGVVEETIFSRLICC